MKKYIIMCLLIIFLSGCVRNEYNEKLLNQISVKDDYITKLENKKQELESKITELENNNEKLKLLVNSKGKIYHRHYHFMETKKDSLYLIFELGDVESGNYTRQLWRYRNSEDPYLLYESKGLDFRVSPNEEVIAVDHSNNNLGEITFINKSGDVLFEPDFSEYEDYLSPYLYGWSDDSKYLWGTMQPTYEINYFFIINTDNWDVKIIENTNVFGSEIKINTQNGWVCYSDYPVFLEVDAHNEFIESKKEVKLFLYNIFTEEKININSSITKKFLPKWIDENTVEYNDPLSDERVKYTLK